MELVYLWVKKHKNIYKQGFNFSPRFKCSFKPSYDDNGNLDNNCTLLINKSTNISIFPNNLNITAIVGENGTGKSGLLEILSNKYRLVDYKSLFFIFYDKDKEVLLLSGALKEHQAYINLSQLDEKNEFKISIIDNIEPFDDTKTIYFSSLSNEYNLEIPLYFKSKHCTNISDISTTHLLNQIKPIEIHYKAINYNSSTGFDKIYHSYRIQQIQMSLIAIKNGLEVPFKLPKKIFIRNINIKNLFEKIIKNSNSEQLRKIIKIIGDTNSEIKIFKNYVKMNLIISLLLENQNEHNPIREEISNIVLNLKKGFALDELYDKVKKELVNKVYRLSSDNTEFKAQYIEEFFVNSDKLLKQIENFYSISNNSYEIELDIDNTDFSFLETYEKLIQQSEYFWDINWRILSSGEETFLYQFSRFYFLKGNYKDNSSLNLKVDTGEAKNLIFLIDEGELTLHPQWQKKYINYMIEFFNKNFKQNIHIILTSHSPFILSDLSKDNVIFLEKYNEKDEEVKNESQKIGNCKNATKDIEIKTFGANIHTLLSHGFFMKDGLMGEFAKKEINKIIENLNNKDYNPNIEEKKRILTIINIIGEDFLRAKLLDMYYKKFDDDFIKKKRKNELELQKEKIEKELKNL
ncbi:AAA family ATPase [Arcobacter porcinus]|uniref:AAA domain-containing protein n=1 Tax=Arcobacter porcinus TaxID=1935204 RepID=A0ABX2YAG9_9BACT|nr:AAA family ATPase [Arcobacter porcinus]OCL90271.1 hypothetical protein AAX28_01752 [Arcobacter porcinus]